MKSRFALKSTLLALGFLVMPLGQAFGQDIEPRRWTPLPLGLNVIGAGYGRVQGDVFFNPVLEIEDADVEGNVAVISYVRSFAIAKKLARLDVLLPWQNKRWSGLLDGVPATASRTGLADPRVRLSMILAGAPASGSSQNTPAKSSTVVGAAVSLRIPLGEYYEDKLLNLGQNRFVIRPQIGVVHTRDKWSYELTGSVFLYGDNDEFFDGNKLEQDPLYAAQAHLIRVFDKPGYWAALSAAYGWNGQSTINGNPVDDSRRLVLSALAVGVPIGMKQGLRFAYIRQRTNTDTGADIDSLSIGWSYRF